MNELYIFRDLILILSTAFVCGLIIKLIKLPTVVGYLMGGVVIGSVASGFINRFDTVQNVAEIGIVFLLFTVGLEFSISRVKELGETIIFASVIQVLMTIMLSIIIFPVFFGFDFYNSLFLGAVFSLSSTVVSTKILSDRGELDTLHGEIASGWLVMQDLYTLPMIILLPATAVLTRSDVLGFFSFLGFSKSLVISFISFIAVLYLGKKIMPFIFEKIADLKSRELLLIAAVLVCLIFAYFFKILGFSTALGAFIAGILLSSSSVNHGIFAEIRPLKDLFSTIFFVSLGFLISPAFLLSSWQIIIFITVIIIILKFLISSILVLFLGYHSKTATLVGFSLVSVGEFAFVLALIGVTANLISQNTYMTILSVSFLSIIISIPTISLSDRIYYFGRKLLKNYIPQGEKFLRRFDGKQITTEPILTDHVVILGHGRVGKYISRALSLSGTPYIVIDYNHNLVRHLRHDGIKVVYGDPVEIDVLKFAGVEKARILILAYADRHTQETVVINALTLNPKIKIICRTHFEGDQKKLKALGVSTIIQPEFEAAITMTRRLLHYLSEEPPEIEKKIEIIRREHA